MNFSMAQCITGSMAPLYTETNTHFKNKKGKLSNQNVNHLWSVILFSWLILFCVWARYVLDPLQASGSAAPTPSSPSLQTSVSVPSVLESCCCVFSLRNCLLLSACVCVSVMSWEGFSGVRVLALPGDVSYAANHGVYLADGQVGTRRFAFEKTWNLALFFILFFFSILFSEFSDLYLYTTNKKQKTTHTQKNNYSQTTGNKKQNHRAARFKKSVKST